MNTKLRIGGQTGMSVFAVITDENDKVADLTAEEFVTYNVANADDYALSILETRKGYYSVDFPSWIAAGDYHINFHSQIVPGTVDLATPDDVIQQKILEWDGTAIVDDLVNEASITDICNMALAHLAQTDTIANFETEDSEAARLCRTFYATARDKALRDFPWPFATQFATLSLVEETPTTEWARSYRYPGDCLMIRRLLSGTRNDSRSSRVPYRLARDASGQLIYTDLVDAEVEYTIRETNPSFYTPDFTLALSLLLATYIAPKLTGGLSSKLTERALELYDFEIRNARANARNEIQPDEHPDSEFVRARI